MMFLFVRQRITWALCCIVVAALPQVLFAQWNADQMQPASALSQSQLIIPEELVKVLQSSKSKPLIFNVGPRMLYMRENLRSVDS